MRVRNSLFTLGLVCLMGIAQSVPVQATESSNQEARFILVHGHGGGHGGHGWGGHGWRGHGWGGRGWGGHGWHGWHHRHWWGGYYGGGAYYGAPYYYMTRHCHYDMYGNYICHRVVY